MRKIYLVLALAVATVSSAVAQTSPFEKDSKVLQVGLGLGGGFAASGSNMSLPPIQVRYDHGITENISIGGVVGIAGSTYKFSNNDKISYTYLMVAARGNYHFDINVEKLDLYAGLTLGYNNVSHKSKGVFSSGYNYDNGGVLFGAQVGANYYIKENLALWADVGYGLGYLNLGVAFKF